MKYLKKFNTEGEVIMTDLPNVVLVADTGKVMYNVPIPQGVYIQHIDGRLFKTESWKSGAFAETDANGVAVFGDNARFVIAKTDVGNSLNWTSDTTVFDENIVTTTNSTIAGTDYNGAANTAIMIATDKSGAGYSCANYSFPNGAKGYLPAAGEWLEAYKYKTDINTAMALIGDALANNYWTSTQYNKFYAWEIAWNAGYLDDLDKTYSRSVRAFSAL